MSSTKRIEEGKASQADPLGFIALGRLTMSDEETSQNKTEDFQTPKRKRCPSKSANSSERKNPEKKKDSKKSPMSHKWFSRKPKTCPGQEASSGAAPSGEFASLSVTDKELKRALDSCTSNENESGTYSGAAKKAKREFPYAVFIMQKVSDDVKSERITSKDFTSFLDHVTEIRFQKLEESCKLDIEYSSFRSGFGIIAANDKQTSEWIKLQIDIYNQKCKNLQLVAYNKWDRGSAFVYYGFLHGPHWREKKGTITLVKILAFNKIEGEFYNLVYNTKNTSGVFISFEPKPDLAEKLNAKMTLDCGVCKLRLSKRLRQQKSEVDFLAQFQVHEEKS